MKEMKLLLAEVKKTGVAGVAFKLGLRDTNRVKNWIYRKSIPELVKPLIIKVFGNENTKH